MTGEHKPLSIAEAEALAMMPQIPHISFVDDFKQVVALVVAACTLGLLVLAAAILAGIALAGPMATAQALIGTILIVFGFVCLAVVIFHRAILMELITLEELGYLVQEETIVGARDARRLLANIRSKLDAGLHPGAAELPDLLRHMGPLVGMLMRKEKNVLSWAMFGMKVAKNAFDIYRQQQQNK